MSNTKRKILTTDDLMRKQEEPDRKRTRRIENSESGEKAAGSISECDEDQSEPETEGQERGEADPEDDGDDVDLDDAPGTSESNPDRFNFSRITSKPRTQYATSIPSKTSPSTFLSLGVSPPLQAALSTMSIRTPTEVQAACIPPLLAGVFLFDI